jgi:hypothetical protein
MATATCIGRLFALRTILNELAWANKLPDLPELLRREDIPRTPHALPRPLTAGRHQLLEQEFLRRNSLGGNVFLLLRRTGMRIGECADSSFDSMRSTGPDQWALHVPLGKLKTERMVPGDTSVAELVQRLRFFRFLDPLPPDGAYTGKLLGTASHESDADGTTMAAGESNQTLMPQPVGQSPTALLHRTNCPHRRNACPDPTECLPTSGGIHNRSPRKSKKRNDVNEYLFTLFLTACGQPEYCKTQPASLRSDACPHHRNQVPTSLEYARWAAAGTSSN